MGEKGVKLFKPDRSDGKARTEKVGCRFLPEGRLELERRAREDGVSLAEFLRRAIKLGVKEMERLKSSTPSAP